MNAAAVVKQGSTLIQSVDWTRFSVEQWLEQYGLWINDQRASGVRGYSNPMASWSSTQEDRRRREYRLSQCMLLIGDDEGRAVMRLLADLKVSHAQVAQVIVGHAEYNKSFDVIAGQSMGAMSKGTVMNRYKDGLEYLQRRMGI